MTEPFLVESQYLISLGAMAVSILAAIYSRRAITEAKRANKINLHPHQKELYGAFKDMQRKIEACIATGSEVNPAEFFPHAKTAPLYISKELAHSLMDYSQVCFQLVQLNARIEERKLTESFEAFGPVIPGGVSYPNEKESIESLKEKRDKVAQTLFRSGARIEERLLNEIKLV